jgi:hypothetical protein
MLLNCSSQAGNWAKPIVFEFVEDLSANACRTVWHMHGHAWLNQTAAHVVLMSCI